MKHPTTRRDHLGRLAESDVPGVTTKADALIGTECGGAAAVGPGTDTGLAGTESPRGAQRGDHRGTRQPATPIPGVRADRFEYGDSTGLVDPAEAEGHWDRIID